MSVQNINSSFFSEKQIKYVHKNAKCLALRTIICPECNETLLNEKHPPELKDNKSKGPKCPLLQKITTLPGCLWAKGQAIGKTFRERLEDELSNFFSLVHKETKFC